MGETHSSGNDAPGIRINKYLAEAGQGSRRNVEQFIREGRVQVDGETVRDLSVRVTPDQEVRLDGGVLNRSRRTVVFAMNKPVRVLVSEHDPEGRPLAIDSVRPHYSGRLFSIGRLDFMSSGLILFTNDGDLAQKLMRPAAGVDREYVVETREPIPDDMLEAFRRGISVERVQYRLQEYRRHSARRVALILREGKNREIRRVFAHFRLKVRRIYRNRYGPIRLGSLPEGQVRPLTDNEVERLRHAVSGNAPRRTATRRTPRRRRE
ncbi:MAG: pseudouridine synthase [Spirochaeta sp.]|jgi:23S rRNA pseudouridine2605 synthase|nr:pseudouridine synthase [Spirochaeta sp.]